MQNNLKTKSCADCGAPFKPRSGAQKWCPECKEVRAAPDAELLLAQEGRMKTYGAPPAPTPLEELVAAQREYVTRQRVSAERAEARLAAVLTVEVAGAPLAVVIAHQRLYEERERIAVQGRAYAQEAEDRAADADLLLAHARATGQGACDAF